MITFLNLPSDVLKYTFTFMDPEEQVPLLFVNKKLSALVLPIVKSLKGYLIVDWVARVGSEALALWLNNYVTYYNNFSETAANCGNLNLLKLASDKKWPLSPHICFNAAAGGNVDVLKWLSEKGTKFYEGSFITALRNGRLEAVKWLKQSGCPYPKDICRGSADHLEVLKYFHQEGESINEHTFSSALEYGNIDVLNYLHDYRCPVDRQIINICLKEGHPDVVKFLRDKGYDP